MLKIFKPTISRKFVGRVAQHVNEGGLGGLMLIACPFLFAWTLGRGGRFGGSRWPGTGFHRRLEVPNAKGVGGHNIGHLLPWFRMDISCGGWRVGTPRWRNRIFVVEWRKVLVVEGVRWNRFCRG